MLLANLRLHLPWHKKDQLFLKNFLFGVEDSLVSTVGLLSGVASANVERTSIILTGLILIVVEGFSMGIGSFMTEETAEEMAGTTASDTSALKGGLTMFGSYLLSGLIPLAPYFFLSPTQAMPFSVLASLLGLFSLGLGTALYFRRPAPLRRGLKMLLLGGMAVLVGVMIGKTLHL